MTKNREGVPDASLVEGMRDEQEMRREVLRSRCVGGVGGCVCGCGCGCVWCVCVWVWVGVGVGVGCVGCVGCGGGCVVWGWGCGCVGCVVCGCVVWVCE